MDWTEIGELLPIFMLPTEICLVFLRFMVSIIQKNRLKTKENNENLQPSALSLTTWCPRPDSNRHGSFPPRDFKSRASTSSATRAFELMVRSSELGDKRQSILFDYELPTNNYELKMEAASGFEPLHRSFADCSLSHLGTPPLVE